MQTDKQYRLLPNDEQLIAGIKEGNSAVLETVYKTFFPGIQTFVLQNSGTEEEARDLCQEAIIVLYEKLSRQGTELSCSVKTYLYSVTRNLWLKKLSSRNKSITSLNEQEEFLLVEEDTADWSEKELMYEKINHSMELLGNPCADIIKDFYYNRLSIQEIADKHGYNNTDTAKNQKYKCLMRLRRYLTLGNTSNSKQ